MVENAFQFVQHFSKEKEWLIKATKPIWNWIVEHSDKLFCSFKMKSKIEAKFEPLETKA